MTAVAGPWGDSALPPTVRDRAGRCSQRSTWHQRVRSGGAMSKPRRDHGSARWRVAGGPILPLITGFPDVAHAHHERHLCIDTTAAGGNAALLAG